MRNRSSLVLQCSAVLALVVGTVACGPNESAPKPVGSATASASSAPTVSASSSAAAPAPSAQPSAGPAKLAAEDSWLLVRRGSAELAIIELRAGAAPVVHLERDGDDSKALQKKVAELAAASGIPLEMHEPPPDGKRRGPLGTTLMKPGDRLYPTALKIALEQADYLVDVIPAFDDATPPARIRQLNISRDGEKVGTIDFSKTPPVVTIHTTKSEGSGLTREWEDLSKLEKLVVRFHGPKAGVETLFEVEAKPGSPDYPNAVRLHLIVNRWYDAQRKYVLEAVP
jgi:hypothetical protein